MIFGLPSLKFRIGSVPVQIELFHFFTVFLLGMPRRGSGILIWMLVAIASVLAHELLHALALKRLRRSPVVSLHGLGGVTVGPGRLTPRQRVGVHLAGPVPMLVLVGLPAMVLWRSGAITDPTLADVVHDVYWVNVWWSVVNLLPIWPLDGGQILAALSEARSGATRWAPIHWASIATSLVGGAFALSQSDRNLYVFVLAVLFAIQNFMRLSGARPFLLHPAYDQDGDSLAFGGSVPTERRHPPPRTGRRERAGGGRPVERLARGWSALSRGDSVRARAEVEPVRGSRGSDGDAAVAAEITAWSWLQERNVPLARDAVRDVRPRTRLSRCLQAAFDLTGAEEHVALSRLGEALLQELDRPAARQAIDYVGRRGLGVPLARELLSHPDGKGFEAAVMLVSVLAECGRREQSDQISSLLFGL